MAQELHLIVVGKLKDKELLSLENDYLKRIKSPALKVHEVRSRSEDVDKESLDVVQKISSLKKDQNSLSIIALTERGKKYDSPSFSSWLGKKIESSSGVIFIIGGAAGHGREVLELADDELSLSALTFPHKLARLLLIEQLYRAQTIRERHPYHK